MINTPLTFKTLFSLFLFFLPTLTFAAGGFGGVSAESKENSFNITWNWNPNIYSPGSSSNFIKICYKKKNSARRICKKNIKTSYAPALLSGLNADTKYKIKVECFCKKKKKNGKWKKAKWRKVATLTQSTKLASIDPDTYSGSLAITETTPSSFRLKFSAGNAQGSDMVRVCYRKSNAWHNLKVHCRNRDHVWTGKNSNRLGYAEFKPGGSFQHIFRGLKHNRQYKFAVVLFASGGGGKVVDTASAHTPKITTGYIQQKSLKKPTFEKSISSQKLNSRKLQSK